MDILKELRIPGYRILRWIFVILIFAPFVVSLVATDSVATSSALKVLVLLLDAVCAYILFWIVKRGMASRYRNVLLAIAVIAIGESIMAFL